ncbi:MAG: phosphodiester glycosidase family protein [Saprospiraceae bacterium]|nr:phosphodiester glycosidase family protein [Saprospiraceae bacterium]
MHLKKLSGILFFLSFLIALSAQQPFKLHWQQEKIAPGLYWQYIHTEQLYESEQSINVLKVNTKKRQLALAFVSDTLLRTSELAINNGAIAAVNAGFFKIREGKGSSTYIKVKGKTIEDIPTQGHELLKGALIIVNDGDLAIEYAQPNEVYNTSQTDETVLVTGPILILNNIKEVLTNNAFNANRHPRTCACILSKNKILLVTVDGRHMEAAGMTLFELTDLMKSFKCKAAINLDGGGSTTMWIKGKPSNGVVNYPSDNKQFDHFGERACANAVVIK